MPGNNLEREDKLWSVSEPDSLMVFSGKPLQIEGG
jgi:hypothetical protein